MDDRQRLDDKTKVKTMVDLTKYKVKILTYPHGEYRLGTPVAVIDEGSIFRIDRTHIFDKHKILFIEETDGKVMIEMTDKTVTLEVVE